ncbi:urease accessory protein UreF [Micromonospora marina]|uniref:urease accessory protein UreF n=1 Tax=Micromonospora marina TaxID=307120 RepID=UPI0034528133
MDATLLLLADGRFPAGAHAHSAGLEAAVAAGRVTDLGSVEAFLRGRLATAGLVTAAFTVAAHRAGAIPAPDRIDRLVDLDIELDARTTAPALRTVSRRQGRALLRAGRAVWPGGHFADLPVDPAGPHQPLVLGLIGAAAGLDAARIALLAVHGTVTGPANAAVRLLGLDPYEVQALLVRLAPESGRVAAAAARATAVEPAQLPSAAAPLTDILAEVHATWEVRLFAS